MDEVADEVLAYIRWVHSHPLPADVRTVDVLGDLRERLDAACPGWRREVYRDAGPGADRSVEVKFRFRGGRVGRGALHQRPSDVRDEPA